MMKEVLCIAAVAVSMALSGSESFAQRSRASVPASEVNGTFHYNFTGKFKGTSNEIKILAMGKGRLRVAFDLTYPFTDGTGELSANVGQAVGFADIRGDTAIYRSDENGECIITIKFVRPGTINVEQEGGSTCGFGHNVTATGRYVRVSRAKPVFDPEN